MPSSTTTSKSPQICLAVDPGYGRLGLAVVAFEGQRVTLLHSTCIETPPSMKFPDRLRLSVEHFDQLIETYAPHHVALESLYFSKNKTTAIKVAELRGAILYVAATHKLSVHEYNPNEIKVAVTGYGKSGKAEITAMVKRLVGTSLPQRKKILDDEMDAIAIALTHAACFPQQAARSRLLQK